MIAKLADVKLTMLAWLPLPPNGPSPAEGDVCLFSNGPLFWNGRWEMGEIIVESPAGRYRLTLIPIVRAKIRWARLNDMSAIFGGAS